MLEPLKANEIGGIEIGWTWQIRHEPESDTFIISAGNQCCNDEIDADKLFAAYENLKRAVASISNHQTKALTAFVCFVSTI